MAKLKSKLICMLVLMAAAVCIFAGCSLFSNSETSSSDSTEYTIIYAYDGTTYTINVKYGDVWSMESIPVKEGYTFAGLYDAEEGGTQYASSTGVGIMAFYDKSNLVLYPQFTAVQYTVMLNYGESFGTTDSVIADYDGSIPNLPKDLTISGKGYMTFKGWYTEANGGGIQVAGSDGVCLYSMDSNMRALCSASNTLQLYAYFESQVYTIQYTYNGETSSVNVTHGDSWSLDVPVKEGYAFNGFYDAEIGGSQYTGADGAGLEAFVSDNNLVLYPHFTIITYTLTLNYGEGSGYITSVNADYDGTIPNLPAYLAVTGKTFVGWYTAADGSGIKVAGDDGKALVAMDADMRAVSDSSNRLTLYAYFETNIYTISYTYEGENYSTEVTYGASWSLAVITKEGYIFDGYYDAETDGTQYAGADGKGLTVFTANKDLVLYPHLTIITYTLVLDYGESSGSVESVTADYDGTIPDLPADLTIDGKGYMAFVGWYTEANGNGTQVAGSDGKTLVSMDADMRALSDSSNNIQLYAHFETQVYTISYTYDGETTTINVTHGASWSLAVITKEGYIFDGYYDAETDGTQYAGSDGKSLAEFTADKDLVLYPNLTIITYTLVLDYGESSGTVESVTADYDGTIPGLPANLTIDGKGYMTFVGWYTEANGGGIQVAGSNGKTLVSMDSTMRAVSNSNNTLTLYAHFETQVYTISYTYNGETTTINVTHGDSWSLAAITKEGYIFEGYFDAETDGTQYAGSDGKGLAEFTADKDLVLYPRLTIITYTLVLDYGESSGTVESVTADYDGTIPDLPADLTIDGKGYMAFMGWYTEANGGGIQVAGSNGKTLVTMDSTMRALSDSSNNVQLYAYFQSKVYTIKYSYGGKTISTEVTHGDSWSLTVPEKEGYTFNGFYDAETGGTQYTGADGYGISVFTSDTDLVLYPQFTIITYTLKLNYGDSSGSVTSVKANYDGTIPDLPANLTIDGKAYMVFMGWYTEANGGGIQVAGSDGECLYTMDSTMRALSNSSNVLQLYAYFQTKVYTISYTYGGETTTINVTHGDSWNLAVPEKEGYTFNGFYDAAEGGTQYADSNGNNLSVFTLDDDLVLYPQFTIITYTIKLNYGESSGSVASFTAAYGEAIPDLPANLTIDGKVYMVFKGWYTSADGSGTQVAGSDGESLYSTMAGDICSLCNSSNVLQLYAYFESRVYTIQYTYNGSTVSTGVTHGSNWSLTVPEKEGYTFDGFFDASGTQYADSDGNGLSAFTLDADLELYPQFTIITYTIKLNYGESSGSVASYTVTYGEAIPDLPANLTIDGKAYMDFKGWYTSADGSGTQVAGSDGASLYSTMAGDTCKLSNSYNVIQLYAYFEPHVYTIKYTYNSETISIEVTHGSSWSLTEPEKEGYTFDGFFDAGGTQYADSNGNSLSTFTLDADLVLYPQFTIKTYTIKLYYGESSGTAASVTAEYEDTIPDLPADLTIDGKSYMIFKGWYTALNGGGIQVAGSDGVCLYIMDSTLVALCNTSDTLQLYAYFEKQTYTVKYETSGGTSISSQTYSHGDSLELPDDPERDGYLFLGWYDSAQSVEYVSGEAVTADITIYAVWRLSAAISTYEELAAVTNSTSLNYHLLNDINCNGAKWSPISSYSGIFDGCGYTIYNFTISTESTDSESNTGFFKINNGTICNLTISGATVTASYNYDVMVGALVGVNNGTIDNCSVVSSTISGNADESLSDKQGSEHARYAVVGGMVGKNAGTISNCTVTTSTVSGYSRRQDGGSVGDSNDIAVAYVGGLVGEVASGGVVENCSVTDMKKISGSCYFRWYWQWAKLHPYIKVVVGGVIGIAQSGSSYSECTSDMTSSSSILTVSYTLNNDGGSEGYDNCKTYTGAIYGIDNS